MRLLWYLVIQLFPIDTLDDSMPKYSISKESVITKIAQAEFPVGRITGHKITNDRAETEVLFAKLCAKDVRRDDLRHHWIRFDNIEAEHQALVAEYLAFAKAANLYELREKQQTEPKPPKPKRAARGKPPYEKPTAAPPQNRFEMDPTRYAQRHEQHVLLQQVEHDILIMEKKTQLEALRLQYYQTKECTQAKVDAAKGKPFPLRNEKTVEVAPTDPAISTSTKFELQQPPSKTAGQKSCSMEDLIDYESDTEMKDATASGSGYYRLGLATFRPAAKAMSRLSELTYANAAMTWHNQIYRTAFTLRISMQSAGLTNKR